MESAADRQGWNDAIVDVVVEFLEAAVHSLLQARRVYPQDIFERRRKYGVPVWMSRHPELNGYIHQVLLRTKPLMERGVVRKVFVCFFQEAEHVDQAPTERVAFDVRVHDDDEASLEPLRVQEVEDQLRSALLQIQKSSAHLPVRQGCTFALHVEARESHGRGGEEEEEEGHEGSRAGGTHGANQDGFGASPVRAALRGGKWLLADNDSQGVLAAEPERRQLVPIKSVRCRGLALDLTTEMGDCPA